MALSRVAEQHSLRGRRVCVCVCVCVDFCFVLYFIFLCVTLILDVFTFLGIRKTNLSWEYMYKLYLLGLNQTCFHLSGKQDWNMTCDNTQVLKHFNVIIEVLTKLCEILVGQTMFERKKDISTQIKVCVRTIKLAGLSCAVFFSVNGSRRQQKFTAIPLDWQEDDRPQHSGVRKRSLCNPGDDMRWED